MKFIRKVKFNKSGLKQTKNLSIGRLCIGLAAPGTVWFHNYPATKNNMREDKIFAFTRVYVRDRKVYLWALVIGRLKLIWFPKKL